MHLSNIRRNVFTYLHQPYDYEKQQVIKELQCKCDQIYIQKYGWDVIGFSVDEMVIRLMLQ